MAELFNLAASAFRFGGTITATTYATLPDGCHEAEITDIYPGGNIQYVVDPGSAQVFVRFKRRDGPCQEVIRDWEDSREIPDDYHDKLEVIAEFEEQEFSITVPVNEFRLAEGGDIDPGFNPQHFACQFIVIALVADGHENYPIGCRVLHENAIFPMVYRRVFGPASRADCEAWRSQHCLSREAAAAGQDRGG
ncbi:MAG: hypothetical protein WBR13_02610 [Allosphingosinicella sp.]